MKNKFMFFVLLFLISLITVTAQTISESDKKEILSVLENQRIAWNEGNIEKYMEGYWKSDSLRFIGKNGIRYGWQATYEAYLKGYPDKDAMGFLEFEVVSLELLNSQTAFMIGKWNLTRKKDNLGGYFTLIWYKINGKWVIKSDHTS